MKLEYWRLLLYGIHVGHSFRNSILFAAWFIFTYRQNLYIINLYKTLWNLRNGFLGLDFCVKYGNPVWFINIERSTEIYIRSSAKTCGEFSYTTFWIHGMISNYLIMLISIGKLKRYFKDAWKGTWKKLENQWFFSRYSWPRSAFISNIFNNRWPSNECTISGTPCIGIVDTNVSGDDTNIATPGNDDSNDSIVFYNSYFSKYIIDKKYGIIVRWLNKIRKRQRFLSFAEWFKLNFYNRYQEFEQKKYDEFKKIYAIKYRESTKTKRPLTVDYNFPFLKYFVNGVLSFFGTDRFYNRSYFEGLDIYEPKYYYNIKEEIYQWMFSLHKDTIFLVRIGRFYAVKSSWRHYGYVKKRNMSESIFRLRHLRGVYLPRVKKRDNFYFTNFILNRFNVNRFYKTFLRRRRFRRNKYVYRYLKFHYLNKYIKKIGLLKYYKAIFVKISSFAHVSFTVCSNYYKNKFFSAYLVNMVYGNKTKIKEYNTLYKWIQFKSATLEYLSFIVNHNKFNKYIKFLYIYKVFTRLKRILFKKFWAPALFWQYNYYLLNWYSNRKMYRRFMGKKKWGYKKLRRLKNINKLYTYINFFYRSIYFRKKFERFFFNLYKINNINKYSCKYFKVISKYYRNKLIKFPIAWRYKRVAKYMRHVKRVKKYWVRKRVHSLAVITKVVVYDMIKEEYYGKLRELIHEFRANQYMFTLIRKWHKMKTKAYIRTAFNIFKTKLDNYSFWYEEMNTIKRKIFKLAFKNFYCLKRLFNVANKKFHRENSMNFFPINKIFYNHEILLDWKYNKHLYALYLKNLKTKEKLGVNVFFKFLDKYYQGRKIREFYYDNYNWTLMKRKSLIKKFKMLHKNKKFKYSWEKKNKKFVKNYKNKKLFKAGRLYKWIFNLNFWLYKRFKFYKKTYKYCSSYWEKKKIIKKIILTYVYISKFYFYYYKYFLSKKPLINFYKEINKNYLSY
jgi:small subunit ribosomal protein S2